MGIFLAPLGELITALLFEKLTKAKNEDEVKAILDECAAEFPYHPMDNTPIFEQLMKLARDRHVWFCKWLGEK
jgi:hypothetical protein